MRAFCRSARFGLRGRLRAQISAHARDALRVALRVADDVAFSSAFDAFHTNPPLPPAVASAQQARLVVADEWFCGGVLLLLACRRIMLVVLAPIVVLSDWHAPPVFLQLGVYLPQVRPNIVVRVKMPRRVVIDALRNGVYAGFLHGLTHGRWCS